MERQSVVKMKEEEEEGRCVYVLKTKEFESRTKANNQKSFKDALLCSALLLGCENRMCVGGTGKLMTDILFIV